MGGGTGNQIPPALQELSSLFLTSMITRLEQDDADCEERRICQACKDADREERRICQSCKEADSEEHRIRQAHKDTEQVNVLQQQHWAGMQQQQQLTLAMVTSIMAVVSAIHPADVATAAVAAGTAVKTTATAPTTHAEEGHDTAAAEEDGK